MNLPTDENKGPALIAIIWTANGIATFFVSCRIYTRVQLTRSPWIDDAVILLSLAICLAGTSIVTASIAAGFGRHEVYLGPADLCQALKLNLIAQPFHLMGFAVPKVAVALLLFRLIGPAKNGVWFLRISMSILILGAILVSIFNFVHCNPIDSAWEQQKHGRCWSSKAYLANNTIISIYSALCDLALAISPISIFWKLQMKLRKKIGICCVMGLGIFACVCALIKVATIVGLGDHSDITWSTTDLFIWTAIEASVVIICACVPTLGPLVQLILLKRSTNTAKSEGGPYVIVDQKRLNLALPRDDIEFSELKTISHC